jgi:hypothetical protein
MPMLVFSTLCSLGSSPSPKVFLSCNTGQLYSLVASGYPCIHCSARRVLGTGPSAHCFTSLCKYSICFTLHSIIYVVVQCPPFSLEVVGGFYFYTCFTLSCSQLKQQLSIFMYLQTPMLHSMVYELLPSSEVPVYVLTVSSISTAPCLPTDLLCRHKQVLCHS